MALASPVAAGPLGGSPTAAASIAPIVRIDNFGRVDATLYRGAQPEGRDYADLKTLGVKTIVNLTSDDADPMTTHTAPTPAQLTQFLSIVNDPASQPVYVHCVGGRHRTGVMTAAYRMTHEGWSGDQAFKEMKQYNFGSDFLHPEFKQFVYGYHPDANVAAVASVAAATVQQR